MGLNVKRRSLRNLCRSASVLLLLVTSEGVFAQQQTERGNIFIKVIDGQTRKALVDAQIQATSRDGETTSSQSSAQGEGRLSDLMPGMYELRISQPGYQVYVDSLLRVNESKTTPVTVELLPSTNIERIEVVNSARVVDRSASAGAGYMNQEMLRSAVGSGGDVLRALDGLPGLFSSGEFSNFTVRGRGPKDNLIFVDDIPFQNVVHFDDAFGDPEDLEGGGRFSVFAPNIIGGAEFQPGGWNPAYGGGAASLLKLNVAEGNPDSENYTLRLDLAGLEVGYSGPSKFDEDTSILFSARQLDFGRVFETFGADDIGSPELTDIILKTTTALNDTDTLNVLAIFAPEEYTRDIDNALASDEDDPGNWEDLELANSEADNALLAVTYSALLRNDAQWVNRFYFRDFNETTSLGEALPYLVADGTPASDIPVRENILSSSIDEQEFGWRSDYTSFNSFGQFDAGIRVVRISADYQQQLNDDQWIRYVYEGDDARPEGQQYVVLTPENTDSTYSVSATNFAAFANQDFDFGDWNVRAGLRFDKDGITDETLISPRIGSFWQINDRWQMTTTAGIYYQPPSFNDLASDNSNANLENERTTQVSVGWKYAWSEDISLLFEPYYQKLDNLVIESDRIQQLTRNTGEGYSWGFDTMLNKRFSNGWSLQANYSYNDSRVKDTADSPYYDADFSRPHFVQLGGVYELNDRWRFSARWKWASGAPRDSFIVNENVLPGSDLVRFSKEITARNVDRFAGFSSINFRADYRRQFDWADVIAFVDVINLLGSDNPSSAEFNERTGLDVVEDGESIILFGLRFQW